jgi:antitoxin (DNA-binding transcriptional repressor) of toxin-antitoxin stability system
MGRAPALQARAAPRALIGVAETGAEVAITRHGRAVARLAPRGAANRLRILGAAAIPASKRSDRPPEAAAQPRFSTRT